MWRALVVLLLSAAAQPRWLEAQFFNPAPKDVPPLARIPAQQDAQATTPPPMAGSRSALEQDTRDTMTQRWHEQWRPSHLAKPLHKDYVAANADRFRQEMSVRKFVFIVGAAHSGLCDDHRCGPTVASDFNSMLAT